ncbi:hypothetical protein Acr_24g0013290 [Actinidia rufa]|uniref:Uncharacterized protein n=1 Tax=Actinidia rufa TaxID=165716 RepID=A0A7J0GWC2_9ERIC|nr:hypothetical protein Acr_24g0013290 [Actinidia rufa]
MLEWNENMDFHGFQSLHCPLKNPKLVSSKCSRDHFGGGGGGRDEGGVVLSAYPGLSPDDYAVVVIYGWDKSLAFIKSGDKDWTAVDHRRFSMTCQDVVVNNYPRSTFRTSGFNFQGFQISVVGLSINVGRDEEPGQKGVVPGTEGSSSVVANYESTVVGGWACGKAKGMMHGERGKGFGGAGGGETKLGWWSAGAKPARDRGEDWQWRSPSVASPSRLRLRPLLSQIPYTSLTISLLDMHVSLKHPGFLLTWASSIWRTRAFDNVMTLMSSPSWFASQHQFGLWPLTWKLG